MVKLVTEFPFLGVKCHTCHTFVSVTRSRSHSGPSLEYQFWVWSQSKVLTLVISCNHINPGVLDWVSCGFLWCDTSNLFFFFIFSISVPLWLPCLFSPVLLSLCLLHPFSPVLPRNLMGKILWIHGLIDQFSSGEFFMTSINCLLCEFLFSLSRQDIDNSFQSKHVIATPSKARGHPDDTVYIDQLCLLSHHDAVCHIWHFLL